MNLHEYQAKQLFSEYGLPVSKGATAETSSEAAAAADIIGGNQWVVKAQVHAGGRGKAGGVKLVSSKSEIEEFAHKWLGNNLVTYQTDEKGLLETSEPMVTTTNHQTHDVGALLRLPFHRWDHLLMRILFPV